MLRVFEIRVLKMILGPQDKVTVDSRRLFHEELNDQ